MNGGGGAGEPSPRAARRGAVGSVVVVIALTLANLAAHVLGWSTVWLGPVVASVLLAFAWGLGLSRGELGLGRDRLRAGLRWGGVPAAVLLVVYLTAAILPPTRSLFIDDRYNFTVLRAVFSALVVIPIGTVLYEEIAFRSVLWGFLARVLPPGRVLLTTSVLFAAWHVFPALGHHAHNEGVGAATDALGAGAFLAVLVGTLVVTGVGGAVFGWLRLRSGSVLASVLLHWATNGLGVLTGLLARSLGT